MAPIQGIKFFVTFLEGQKNVKVKITKMLTDSHINTMVELVTHNPPNETRSTGSVGKLNIMESILNFVPSLGIPNFVPSLGSADSGMAIYVSLLEGPWEIKSIPRGTTYHMTAGCIETPVQGLVTSLMPGRQMIIS